MRITHASVLFGLSAVLCLRAASLTQSSGCLVNGATTLSQFGTSGCSVADGRGSSAQAAASGEWTGSAFASPNTPFTALDVDLHAWAQTYDTASPLPGGGYGFPGGIPAATSTSAFTANLETAGPTRTGYLQINSLQLSATGTADHDWTDNFAISIGPLSETCSQYGSMPIVNCGAIDMFRLPYLVPVTIGDGQPFVLTLLAQANSTVGPFDQWDAVSASSDLTLGFLESDGKTPVLIYDPPDVPEPGTWGLLGAGLVLGGAVAARKSRVRQNRARKQAAG